MASRENSTFLLHFAESNPSAAVRPQFSVGGQVSILRNSHPKLDSTSLTGAATNYSWATTGMQTPVNEYHSEMSTLSRNFKKSDRHFDKSDRHFDKSEQHSDKSERHYDRSDQHFDKRDRHFEKNDHQFEKSDRQFDKNDRHFDKSDRHFDKSDKFGEMSATPTSRSLNPELLMREFEHDEDESSQDSPSPGFKSSFAREVMQNVRKNVPNQTLPARRYLAINQQDNNEERSYTSSTPRNRSFYGNEKENVSQAKGGRLSMPAMNTSRRAPNFTSNNKYRSQFAARNLLLLDDDSDDREEKTGARDDLWMTSNQFKAMLEKQEIAESEVVRIMEEEQEVLNEAHQLFDGENENEDSTCSYLDQEAKIPFRKLKQTCDDLGFTFTEQEWSELRRLLSIDQTKRSGDDFVVRNGDFFSAVHLIMSNKHSRLRRDETLKYSMKSDSGGEMESCRSSDSELERELHEKEREIQMLQRELSSGYRSLAERDTELVRVRLECQRLLQDNRHLKEQNTRFRMYNHNPRKHMELEREIDQLRWKLVAMEDSRRTYESATERLVVFLEQVTTMLQATSPSQRKFLESTRAEVSKIAKRTRAQNQKRFSVDSNAMFRAESMPGLNSSAASSSVAGMSNGPFHGSLLSLSTTLSGGEMPMTTSSSSASSHRSSVAIPRRASSTSSSVQRSQSTQSKRSTSQHLPSLRERKEKENSESIYVNSDIIRELIAEESLDDGAELPRPKSAAAILHGNKRHVCEIKIGSTGSESLHKPGLDEIKKEVTEKRRSTSTPAKRSNSVLSSASSNNRINIPNQKASKILGLDPQQSTVQNFATGGADSGRFSLGSRTSSLSARSSPILPKKSSNKKTITINATKDAESENEILKVSDKVTDEQPIPEQKISERRLPEIDVVDVVESIVVVPIIKESRSSSNPPSKEMVNRLKEDDRAKFKSLGDLHIEKGLPAVPVPIDSDTADEDKRQLVLKAAHSLMKGVRSMMSRDKTLTITPKKASSKSLSSVGLVRNPKPTLQLLSHTSFPGLPTYPVLAASHSSPWNC